MNNPLNELQRLYDEGRTIWITTGQSSSKNGRIFFNIWSKPSDKILSQGYGETIEEAMRDALAKVPGTTVAPTPAVGLPGLPGLTTRPTLPGMTR